MDLDPDDPNVGAQIRHVRDTFYGAQNALVGEGLEIGPILAGLGEHVAIALAALNSDDVYTTFLAIVQTRYREFSLRAKTLAILNALDVPRDPGGVH